MTAQDIINLANSGNVADSGYDKDAGFKLCLLEYLKKFRSPGIKPPWWYLKTSTGIARLTSDPLTFALPADFQFANSVVVGGRVISYVGDDPDVQTMLARDRMRQPGYWLQWLPSGVVLWVNFIAGSTEVLDLGYFPKYIWAANMDLDQVMPEDYQTPLIPMLRRKILESKMNPDIDALTIAIAVEKEALDQILGLSGPAVSGRVVIAV